MDQKSNMNRRSEPISTGAAIIVQSKYFQFPAKKSKRYRSAFSTEQIKYLESEFKKFPYIGSANRKEVADILKIPDRAVKIWFQNRRMREKRESFVVDKNKIDNVNNDQLNTSLNVTSDNDEKNINYRLQTSQNEHLKEPEMRNISCTNQSSNSESKRNNKIIATPKAGDPTRIKPYKQQYLLKIPQNESNNQTLYFEYFNNTEKQHSNDKYTQNNSQIPSSQRSGQATNFKHFDYTKKQRSNEKYTQNTLKIPLTQSPDRTVYFKNSNHAEKQHIKKNKRPFFNQQKQQTNKKDSPIYFQSMKASETAQDLSLGRNKKIQQPFYQVPQNPNTGMVQIYTQNCFSPPVATSMQSGNVLWKPVSLVPIMPCSPVTISNNPGFPLNNHEIVKGTCHCHGPPHEFNAQAQCNSRLQPQYIMAIPFTNSI